MAEPKAKLANYASDSNRALGKDKKKKKAVKIINPNMRKLLSQVDGS